MKKLLVLVVAGLVLLAASCDTKNIGTQTGPDRGPVPTVTVPAGMLGGVDATWTVSWVSGSGPFTVTWNFGGGGANVGPVAATSPNTQVVNMVNPSITDSESYTYTVVVTDSLGQSGTATGSYTVGPTPNQNPVIDDASFAAGVITVTVSDPDAGDTVSVTVDAPAGMTVDGGATATKVAGVGGGTVTFNVAADDVFDGGSGTFDVTADDGVGGTATTTVAATMPGITLEADTVYAIPLAGGAAVGDPVTIVCATGVPANPFQFCNGIGVCVESDATYVAGTFNAGAVGGGAGDADGIWADMNPGGGFLLPPDNLIQASDIGGGRERWDFNLTPIGGSDIQVAGAVLNFQFSFSAAGTKTLGLQAVSGVNRTYYSDGTSAEYFWGTLMADETGALNVAGVSNTITVN